MNLDTPKYIVSLCGDDALHARAQRYNNQLSLLSDMRADLEQARAWNNHERFGTGFFSSTKAAVPTHDLVGKIASLTETLEREYAEIMTASGAFR